MDVHHSIGTNASALLQDALHPGESLLWSGGPQRIDRWQRLTTLPDQGISWPSAVIAMAGGVGGALSFLPPWSWAMVVCSVLFGTMLYVFWRRACIMLYGAWNGDALVYAVTDKRILFVDGGNRRSPQSIDIALLPEISLLQAADGLSTILFGWPDGKALHAAAGGLTSVDILRMARRGGTMPPPPARAVHFLAALRQEGLIADRKRYRPPRFEAIADGPTVIRHVRQAISTSAASASSPAG